MPDRSILISFVIPTLNRKGSVNRAVRSCLALADTRAAIEVVVLDSRSDDGSWEELHREFDDEPRVRLHSNDRGLGPTRSWLDGAAHVSPEADFVTFLWSDDYVFPWFLDALLPPLHAGASASFGQGIVRDIAESSLPEQEGDTTSITEAPNAVPAFLGKWYTAVGATPSSPAAALFRRDVFETWMSRVETFSRRSGTEERVLWRRAIGPDLYLFLLALSIDGWASTIGFTQQPVVQFSSHVGSITVSSSPWLMETGYWLARTGWLADAALQAYPDKPALSERLHELARAGLALDRTMPSELPSGINRSDAKRDIRRRVFAILRLEIRLVGLPTALRPWMRPTYRRFRDWARAVRSPHRS